MYITDDLIYIQMHKTASTQIVKLLSHLFNGEREGIHNSASIEQIESGKLFLSSIRNPWDWYLSLWTYGVQKNQGIKKRLTDPSNMTDPILIENIDKWKAVYTHGDDTDAFKTWLKMVHDPENSHSLNVKYGGAPLNEICGLYTFRYLMLCCQRNKRLRKEGVITTYQDVRRFAKHQCYIDHFIRQEALEDTLCEGLEKIRPLTEAEHDYIYGQKKANATQRTTPKSAYYDQETIDLVMNREKLIVDKFNYTPEKFI